MLLIPYSTDAPIYHFPWCTIGLIVVNTVVFAGTLNLSAASYDFLCLEFSGINPLQWLTHFFMHGNILHLVGNMLFLWGFGLVVEGKIGWWQFLLMYLFMGMLFGALVQVTLFFALGEGSGLGASAVIFSLMGICVLWAPKNDLHCFLWAGIFSRLIQISIIVFGAIYATLQFLSVFFQIYFQGFHLSSELFHLCGLAIGIPVGIFFLKKDLVDCEGWDYLTLYMADGEQQKLRQSRRSRERSAARTAEIRNAEKSQLEQLNKSFIEAIGAGNDQVACAMYDKYSNEFQLGERWPDNITLKFVAALQRLEKWDQSIPFVVRLLRKHPPEKTTAIRLSLAKALILKTDQPRQGLAVLKKLNGTALPDKHKIVVKKLAHLAKQKQKEGAIELDIHDW